MREITIDDIFQRLFGEYYDEEDTPEYGTPAYDIYENEFEIEVTVEDANWIENEGYGCSRPNEPDEDSDSYDLKNKEKITVSADSLIGNEFKEDFLAHFYTEDLEDGEHSKSILEDWINSSIQKSVDFFNNFTVSDTDSGAPNDIYVDIKVDKTYTMSELDEEWTEDNYFVTGFDTIEESSRTQIFD